MWGFEDMWQYLGPPIVFLMWYYDIWSVPEILWRKFRAWFHQQLVDFYYPPDGDEVWTSSGSGNPVARGESFAGIPKEPTLLERMRPGLSSLADVYKRRIERGDYPHDSPATRREKQENVDRLVAAGYPCTLEDSWEVIYGLTVRHLDKLACNPEKDKNKDDEEAKA